MLIRFATLEPDPDSTHSCGVFVAAHTLRDEGDLTRQEHEDLRLMLAWFNENLHIPEVLQESEHRRAISWFKPAAKEPIGRMWQLKSLLELHGLSIKILATDEPGTLVYEDDWQVIAKPLKGKRF
ncbi:MAG: hypothetical protein ACRERR_02075 [Moraxellaceae bacterium]